MFWKNVLGPLPQWVLPYAIWKQTNAVLIVGWWRGFCTVPDDFLSDLLAMYKLFWWMVVSHGSGVWRTRWLDVCKIPKYKTDKWFSMIFRPSSITGSMYKLYIADYSCMLIKNYIIGRIEHFLDERIMWHNSWQNAHIGREPGFVVFDRDWGKLWHALSHALFYLMLYLMPYLMLYLMLCLRKSRIQLCRCFASTLFGQLLIRHVSQIGCFLVHFWAPRKAAAVLQWAVETQDCTWGQSDLIVEASARATTAMRSSLWVWWLSDAKFVEFFKLMF